MVVEWQEYATETPGCIAEWLNGIEATEGHTVDSVSIAHGGQAWVIAVAKVIKEETDAQSG